MGEHFTIVRFGRGYDKQQVDDFVARTERVRSGAESMRTEDARDVTFNVRIGGYEMREVDDWLDEVQRSLGEG